MRTRISRILAVIGAATILTLAANSIVLAATGSGLVLGRANTASTLTSLVRTSIGPALNLQTRNAKTPPFTTNARGQVANLNASLLGGKPASAFAPAGGPGRVIATAIVNGAGQLTASSGISSITWESGPHWYAVQRSAGSFDTSNQAVSISPMCSASPDYDSISGVIVVSFNDHNNNSVQCGFSLVVFSAR